MRNDRLDATGPSWLWSLHRSMALLDILHLVYLLVALECLFGTACFEIMAATKQVRTSDGILSGQAPHSAATFHATRNW